MLSDIFLLDIVVYVGLIAAKDQGVIGLDPFGKWVAVGIVAGIGVADIFLLDGATEEVDLAKEVGPLE